jgi:hypothetical protein
LPKQRAAPAVSWRVRHERANDKLVAEREKLMSEIVLRARLGDLPPMYAKARTLLTRYWAKGNWRTRAELLPVARMLVVLGAAQPMLQPTRKKPARRRPGQRRAAPDSRKLPEMA